MVPCGAFDGLGMLQQNKGCSSLCGPVAQLGARFHGMEEVIGSIPIRSTNHFKHLAPAPSPSFVASLSANPRSFPRNLGRRGDRTPNYLEG